MQEKEKLECFLCTLKIVEEQLDELVFDENFVYDICDEEPINLNLFKLSSANITEKLSTDIKLIELDKVMVEINLKLSKFDWVQSTGSQILEDCKELSNEDEYLDIQEFLEDMEIALEDYQAVYNVRYSLLKKAIQENKTGMLY